MDMMFNSLKSSDATAANGASAQHLNHNHHHHNNEPTSPNGLNGSAAAADENRKNHNFDASTMRPPNSARAQVASGSVTLNRPAGHKFLGGVGGGGGKRGNGAGVAGSVGTVKPISIKDERILNQAIDYVNEISARSMTDLATGGVGGETANHSQSPKRKFSFRFPPGKSSSGSSNGGTGGSATSWAEKDGDGVGSGATASTATAMHSATDASPQRTRNFTDELNKATDLQVFMFR